MSNSSKKPSVGVIGVGHLGQHHAKHFKALDSVHFAGVFDTDQQRAEKIAERYNTRSFQEINALVNACDAVSIVTPTQFHATVAEQCIQSGKHVFLEKPITRTIEEADALINLAKQKGVLIQVGHIERLNPALMVLKDLDINPKYIEVQRLAPYTTRGTDVPVVLDLMIHDLDIILSLVSSPVKNIRASGVSIMTQSVDIANARLRFNNGTVASLTSSRVAKNKVRKIKIFQRDMYITIDFLLALTEVYRVIDSHTPDPNTLVSAPLDRNGQHREIIYKKLPVRTVDALQLELINFIESINGNSTPIVDGQAGRDALEVALKIQNMIIEDTH